MSAKLCRRTIIIFFLIIAAATGAPVAGFENDIKALMASDTLFLAIDLAHYLQLANSELKNGNLPAASLSSDLMPGVEPSPFILWKSDLDQTYGIKIMTLDAVTGIRKGSALTMALPVGKIAAGIRWTTHFGTTGVSGVAPSPFIVFRAFSLYHFPVSYLSNGTPVAGTPVTITLSADTSSYGYPSCMAELPGSEFTDGKDRLFIGTNAGYIIVVASNDFAAIAVVDVQRVSTSPITALETIPQYGYIALGAVIGNAIKGFHYERGVPGQLDWVFTTEFTLVDSRKPKLQSFDTFGQHDVQLASSSGAVELILADGTGDLAQATIGAEQADSSDMSLDIVSIGTSVREVKIGSLLMLADDESSVQFDPDYSSEGGFSGCSVNITDGINDFCNFLCGDANGDTRINLLDVSYIINALYRGGPQPNPREAADVNSDGRVNLLDVSYIINFLYRGGPDPDCP
jgi:hypothetical protein